VHEEEITSITMQLSDPSPYFSRTIAAIVLVATKTRLQQHDAILCHVFQPDGRNYFIDISVSSQVTVSQYLQSIKTAELAKPNVGLQPDLTIVFGPPHVAQTLVVSCGLPTASTIHVPLDDALEIVGRPRFYDVAQENEWTAGRFAAALDVLDEASDGTMLSELSVIPHPERDALLKWAVAPPSTQCEVHTFSPLIHRYFENVAEAHPEFVAVCCPDTRVTYGELDSWANALATHLVRDFRVCPGDLLLVFFDKLRGVEMLVGILAVVSL
jgi:hypothetical protein